MSRPEPPDDAERERTDEHALPRDGQRRQGHERRAGARLRHQAKHGLAWASGIAALLVGIKTLGELGGSAFRLAIAAQQLNASVSTLAPRLDQLSRREDSLLINQGLLSSHMAKMDTISIEEQRAIQRLTIQVDDLRRHRP